MAYIGNQPKSGKYQKLDSLVFDGTSTTYNLTNNAEAVYPQTATNLIISINGVVQEPGQAYTVSGSQIIFTEAPAVGASFFGVVLGSVLDIGVPTDGSVTAAKLSATAVTDKLGFVPANATHTHSDATTSVAGLMSTADKTKLDGVAASANNYIHPANHPPSIITQDASNRFVTDAEKTAWNAKENALTAGTTAQYYRGDKSWQTLDKASVGLSNVDNTSDVNKPVSTAQQTALNDKLNLTGGTLTGTLLTLAHQTTKLALPANDVNLSSGNFFTKTIAAPTALTVSNTPTTGTTASFILELTNPGSAAITWWSGVKWAGGTAPTLTASGVDILGFYTHDGGTTWRGLVLAKDSK